MSRSSAPIGVIDSGVGGLTVVRELRRLMPQEDILYLGDNANCPYGNRSPEEIAVLSEKLICRLEAAGVKYVAVACNTISSVLDRLRPSFSLALSSILESAAQAVAARELSAVGLIATEFTVSSGKCEKLIRDAVPSCRVIAQGSPTLAALIDRGAPDGEIDDEIRLQVGRILARKNVHALLLACTHYPIVADRFHAAFPQLELIDPANVQAQKVRTYLQAEKLCNPQEKGSLTIWTTGSAEAYVNTARRLSFPDAEHLNVIVVK